MPPGFSKVVGVEGVVALLAVPGEEPAQPMRDTAATAAGKPNVRRSTFMPFALAGLGSSLNVVLSREPKLWNSRQEAKKGPLISKVIPPLDDPVVPR